MKEREEFHKKKDNIIINYSLEHIAYAVRSTDDSISQFKPIYPIINTYKCFEKSQNVYITYLSNNNENYCIELVEGVSSPNPVENILKERECVIYHLCYRVNNFKDAIDYLKKNKFMLITKPFETAMEKGIWACHFYNPKIGIIEIMGKYDE